MSVCSLSCERLHYVLLCVSLSTGEISLDSSLLSCFLSWSTPCMSPFFLPGLERKRFDRFRRKLAFEDIWKSTRVAGKICTPAPRVVYQRAKWSIIIQCPLHKHCMRKAKDAKNFITRGWVNVHNIFDDMRSIQHNLTYILGNNPWVAYET